MNPVRIGTLLRQEVVLGAGGFFFVFALVVPVVLTLVVNLLFGTLFSGKPTLGIADAGSSRLVELAGDMTSLRLRTYSDGDALLRAVENGAVDLGLILPAGFDAALASGEATEVTAYLWGQSLLQNRALLGTTLVGLLRQAAGQTSPLEVVTTILGEGEVFSWQQRLLPFIVLVTVLIGGVMVPASSLVNEKQRRTLRVLTITPATLGEVLIAKGLTGVLLATASGALILALNRAFGAQPLLLLLILALGSVMAATFGILLGALVADINTLFATLKGIGILLYAPAVFFLFPTLPQWIGRLFPTYYLVAPIVEISGQGAGWAEVAPELLILVILIAALLLGTVLVVRRISQYSSDLSVAGAAA